MPVLGEQIAALPMRWDDDGQVNVLMVTSRDTGRWVMPKGWEMDGKKPWAAAAIEAMEEAGAQGYVSREALGEYRYPKIMNDGRIIPCRVQVYPMVVERLKRNWKERHQRKRKWFTPKAAAKRVAEEDLAQLLMSLANKPHKLPIIRNLLDQAE